MNDFSFEDWYEEEPLEDWDEEEPFKDSNIFLDSPYDSFSKYHIFENKLDLIDNYGIYDYFKYSDTVLRLKMVANIYDNLYAIKTADGTKDDHYLMSIDIESRFGKTNCSMGSIGDEINVFSDKPLTYNQFDTLIGVFNELKKYYLETNINKKILFLGSTFGNKLDSYRDCSNIDELIDTLTTLKNEVKLTQESSSLFSEGIFVSEIESPSEDNNARSL